MAKLATRLDENATMPIFINEDFAGYDALKANPAVRFFGQVSGHWPAMQLPGTLDLNWELIGKAATGEFITGGTSLYNKDPSTPLVLILEPIWATGKYQVWVKGKVDLAVRDVYARFVQAVRKAAAPGREVWLSWWPFDVNTVANAANPEFPWVAQEFKELLDAYNDVFAAVDGIQPWMYWNERAHTARQMADYAWRCTDWFLNRWPKLRIRPWIKADVADAAGVRSYIPGYEWAVFLGALARFDSVALFDWQPEHPELKWSPDLGYVKQTFAYEQSRSLALAERAAS